MKTRTWFVGALAVVAGLGTAACGDTENKVTAAGSEPEASGERPDAGWGEQPWLLRFNTASGAEGETTHAVYVRYTPSTGATTVRRLPGLTSQDTYADAQALMVSADQEFVLLDSRVSAADRKAGRLTVFALDNDKTLAVDVRGWSKVAGLKPVGAAFDPAEPQLLRVVDSDKRVWRVDLAARTAVRDGDLPKRAGWIYANGFDKNTGLPFIESLDSPETLPAGNGDDDVRPVERRGGVIRVVDGSTVAGEPALPCGFAGGFAVKDGATWLFCADTPKLSTYRLAKGGDAWEKVGVESKAVVPRTAEELPVVLPPVGNG